MTDVARAVAPPTDAPGPPISYGEAQEAAAQALNQLLVFDDPPITGPDVEILLQCREGVTSAIHQRLFAFGLERVPQVRSSDVGPETLNMTNLHALQAEMLGVVAAGFARLSPESRRRPSDTLAIRHGHPTVERWRSAAVALLAGSHALDSALDQPWLRDHGAGWYLIRDLAVAIEAVVVLDSRLGEIGLLNGLLPGKGTIVGDDARLVTSQCARVATWHATTDAADLAVPERGARARVVVGPVRLVTRAADVAAAQRQLARLLRNLGEPGVMGPGRAPFSAAIARMVTASQLLVVTYAERLAERCPNADVSEIARNFTDRKEVLQTVQATMANLVDHECVEDDKRVPWQQGEITTAIRRLERDRLPASLSAEQLLDLAGATHDVTRIAARNLRRELLRDTGNLRTIDPFGQVGHTRVHKGHPLERALTDLYHLSPPTTPVTHYQHPLHRAALRVTLDLTPTTDAHPPAPFTHPRPAQRGGPSW